jgi:pimeloyl-ACP methyl ester carboxylesterase
MERTIMPFAVVNGIKMNYKVEGKGKPLVMIMGFGSPRSAWSSQVSFFKNKFRVITFDNRGAGKSDKPAGPYTTRMMAADVVKLMDYLDIKIADIVGASMGGMIAQELAINYPEKVSRLVLACTYACQDNISGDAPEQAELIGLSPRKMQAAMAKLACNKPINKFIIGNIAMVMSLFMGNAANIGIEAQAAACAGHNTVDRLSLVKSPTLVIVGTKDRIIKPVSSEVIAQNIPGSILVKIEGGSHMFFMENKKEFNQRVFDFLK